MFVEWVEEESEKEIEIEMLTKETKKTGNLKCHYSLLHSGCNEPRVLA